MSIAANIRAVKYTEMFQKCCSIVPSLSTKSHKGEQGRIGVVGGSPEYTGAPFYSAQSSLRFGGDLAFVFCAKEAAGPIKSYSPELMVSSFYEESPSPSEDLAASAEAVISVFSRLHALVVGPGLGRGARVLAITSLIIQKAFESNLPLVVDADGLWLVSQNLSLVKGYSRCILTPNKVEFQRLVMAAMHDIDALVLQESLTEDDNSNSSTSSTNMATACLSSDSCATPSDSTSSATVVTQSPSALAAVDGHSTVQPPVPAPHSLTLTLLKSSLQSPDEATRLNALAAYLGVTVLVKGVEDSISSGDGDVHVVAEEGSPRRCGGQGDILAGCTAVALQWAFRYVDDDCCRLNDGQRAVMAATLASTVVRGASRRAFVKLHRSTTSPDIIEHIGAAFYDLVDS